MLATLARSNYGDGFYLDEYPDLTQHELEALSLLGESDYSVEHREAPFEPDVS